MLPLSEATISELVSESKPFPSGILPLHWASERNGHRIRNFDLKTESGNSFVIKIRQASDYPMNFSVILGYLLPGSYKVFRLRRYNGRHVHTNPLEKETFYDFHVHLATERYQSHPGFKEDHFAVTTDKYHDLHGAIEQFVNDCGLNPGFGDLPLFGLTK